MEKKGKSEEDGETHHGLVVEMVGGKGRGIHYFRTLDKQSNETSYADEEGNIYETTSSTATHSAGSDDERLDDVNEQFIDDQIGEIFDLIVKVG